MTKIDLKGINQTYGEKVIIENLDFSVSKEDSEGKVIVIVGSSGCGKSTLLRYVSGLQNPTKGETLLNGKEVSPADSVGQVFQQYSSFPWLSVIDNVSLGLEFQGVPKKERHEKAKEIIKLVGLEGNEKKFAQYPNLSGGQLQRVAIARSLLANPEVLLMDEPFGALDIKTRFQMQELLLDIKGKFKPLTILVTHDLSEAVYLADTIYVMASNPGRVVHKIDVNLPGKRDKEMRRDPKFIELVHHLEDIMMEIEK